jgi:hypothetical protein
MTTRCLGIDIGFGFTKAYSGTTDGDGNNLVVSFPTIITAATEPGGFSSHSCVEVDGDKYCAGVDVKGDDPWFDPRNSEFVGSGPWTAVLVEAIRACSFNTYKSTIVLGIPAQQFDKNRAEEHVRALKQKQIYTDNGIKFDFDSTDVRFVPQGFGIFRAFVARNTTDYKSLKIGVVDIGYYTVDLISMDRGRFINGDSRSYPLGISSLLDNISSAFTRKYGCYIPLHRAMQFIDNRQVEFMDEVYELDTDEIMKAYAAQIASVINSYVEAKHLDLGIAGGGGIYVLRKITKLKKKLSVVNSPENANAIGYWLYGTQ